MNVALGIEYSGSEYCGWQRQTHSPSVQQSLEEVLSQIADQPIQVFCAGRTDTGVHATGQVVNFELTNERPLRAWELGTNTLLPDDIAVRWAKIVNHDFHARHTAVARRYRYMILNSRFRSATLAGKVTWKRNSLDAAKMHRAAQALLGENDFSSFQAASCQSLTPMRCVHHVTVSRWQEFVVVDIKANAFLHHMVRNIVGCLMRVGEGAQPEEFVAEVLAHKDRTKAPETAKPDGLYLVDVEYPEGTEIPKLPLGPLALPDRLDI
ncbi:tRNA pseudouridine(38-40) synthase TruA [Aliikangiella marina]|uniref:tRNA pseudouridine synthase A n=1 Tax=Aliikangiella marina TaxID=1712262 RepID=A0A545TID8_9GAMM|nr:tRNA pseudouridine(38-40) synthase TruA [Aliikangiella marina]TQV76990.1 tRNA pseudouridine(38-40) synthase TruA [Aliikangiella marina]